MNDLPVWQLPVMSETGASANAYIPKTAKYHCFIDNASLCKRYTQESRIKTKWDRRTGNGDQNSGGKNGRAEKSGFGGPRCARKCRRRSQPAAGQVRRLKRGSCIKCDCNFCVIRYSTDRRGLFEAVGVSG